MHVAVQAVAAGGQAIRRCNRTELDVRYTGSMADLTTAADRASHAAVTAVLRESFPEHAIVGEDGNAGRADAPFVWYVDALDGTVNFARGIPYYCVSVALWQRDKPLAAAVYDPVHDETWLAGRGHGAARNGARLCVSTTDTLAEALVATQSATTDPVKIDEFTQLVIGLMRDSGGIRMPGSRVLVLCHTAAGVFTGYCERDLAPWDLAAGQLILQEAGGRVTGYDGQPTRLTDKIDIVASNGRVHNDLLALVERAASVEPRRN